MKHIESITLNDKYADKWIIVFDWGETITASDDPTHPYGVFSSHVGKYHTPNEEEVDWEDLPETLKNFVARYIADECKHKNIEVSQTFPETSEVFYKCLDCGDVVDDNGETVIEDTDKIPF